MVTCRITSLYV